MTIPVASKGEKHESEALNSPTTYLNDVHTLLVFHRQNEGRSGRLFCGFFFKFICPLMALFILCFNNYYGPGLQVAIYAKYWKTPWQSMMSKWESVHGPFVREYYYEGKVEKYFPPRTYVSDEDLELPLPPVPSKESCEAVKDLRFDCFPRGVVSEQSCVARGCCYQGSTGPIPSCFYPKGFASYNYTKLTIGDRNVTAELTATFQSTYRKQKPKMYLTVVFTSTNALRILFSSTLAPTLSSWYHPPMKDAHSRSVDRSYDFKISQDALGFQIVRKSTGRVIFDTQKQGGWLFSDQFAQISTVLPTKYIYGLEERANDFPLNTNWNTIALLNHDTVPSKVNGYGSYGSYFCLEGDGKAHSVDFFNSAPVEFRLQPGGLTARFLESDFSIGITLGESPEDVFKNQISFQPMPPFWALGFHLSRFGLKGTDDFKALYGRMKKAQIPLDTMWTDIDYMDHRNDFTLSPQFKDLPKYVDELHDKEGVHYVLIVDPGVSGSEKPGTYPPYDLGMKLDVFVKDPKGKTPLVGRVWNPKTTVFPDFSDPKVVEYWITLIEGFHKQLKFDGIWLDMNEPSNFVSGSISGCPSNQWENPPYVPEIQGGVLNYHTLCMSAKHTAGLHYYVHNSHAALESVVTSFALTQLRKERSFIISRGGSYPTPSFAGVWTGDIYSTWEDMKQSVRDIMTFNLLGQSLIGADICGFNGNTTQNLCRRWHQLGAFYPFSRNHNTDDGIDQDPVALHIEDAVRPALIKRYSLLPYLYTLFFARERSNLPVVRPTFYMFPDQEESFTVDYQFFWGDAILVVPALEEGLSYVKAYIGSGVWYDDASLQRLQVTGTEVVLPAPADHIPILIRGGHVIPAFNVNGSVTTKQLREAGSLKLIVALDDQKEASGRFYWDNGVDVAPKFTFGHFAVTKGRLESHMYVVDYKDHMLIDTVQVFATDPATSVTVNSVPVPFNYNQTTKVLTVEPKISVYQNFTITWQ